MEPKNGEPKLDFTFTDDTPNQVDNRYFLRVEQSDGNMGWSSLVWVTWEGRN